VGDGGKERKIETLIQGIGFKPSGLILTGYEAKALKLYWQ